MDFISLNYSQFKTNTSVKNSAQISSGSVEVVIEPLKSSATPSTIVNISDDGYTLSFQGSLKGEVISFVEKSDEEYKAMSFEKLVNERDGQGKFRADGDTTIYAMNSYGKAAQEALHRVRAQQMENTRNAESLGGALDQFRAKIIESNPGLDSSDIDIDIDIDVDVDVDVEVKDGALTIVGSTLTESQKAFTQNLLDSSAAEAKNLKNAITQFNEGGQKMLNMMIYDEKGHYGGENSEGKAVRHREEFVTMDEFLKDARYGNIASSGGSYTWDKFNDLAGSSKWGAGLVFEE